MRPAMAPSLGSLMTSGHPFAKALRFALIGVFNGSIYAAVTALLVSGFAAPPVLASIAGYCVSVPTGFFGHRRFSFRSNGHWTWEAIRFLLGQALNITVAAGSMEATTVRLGTPYYWGMVVAVFLVPIVNFAFMNFWVFRDQPQRGWR